MAKPPVVIPIRKRESSEQTADAKEGRAIDFWQGRSKKLLTSADAQEINVNIEGLITLLRQWEEWDRMSSALRESLVHCGSKMNRTRTEVRNTRSAVLYARVSSQEQAREGFSIPAQVRLLRQYALERNLEIAASFEEIETAKRTGRTRFAEMVEYLRKNASCRILLVEKTDRLYRNLGDWVTIDRIQGLEVHFVKENAIISEDSRSSEKLIHGIKVLMAKNYIENLSEETRKGMTEKASQGIWPSYAPIGYLNAFGPNGKRTIVPDPALAPLVRRLYELCATGQHSLKELAAIAQSEGLTRGGPIQKSTVNKILRNRVYSGEFEWRGKRYPAAFERIISRDLWLAAQSALDRRLGSHVKKTGHCFPFSGMLTCGSCGFAMVGEIKKGKYVYYHCSGARGKCHVPYVRQEVLEHAYVSLLNEISIDEEVVAWIAAALREGHRDEARFRDESVGRLKQEHARIQLRLDTMYEDRLDGRIDVLMFERKSAEFRERQTRILAEIEAHGTADGQYVDSGVRLLELARNMHRLFEKQVPAEKRRLLNLVVSNSVWKDGKINPMWRQPFDMIADANRAKESHDGLATSGGADFENWLPGMDSNHELDKILKSRNLLIPKHRRSRQKPQKQGIGTKSVQKVQLAVWQQHDLVEHAAFAKPHSHWSRMRPKYFG